MLPIRLELIELKDMTKIVRKTMDFFMQILLTYPNAWLLRLTHKIIYAALFLAAH